MSGKLGGLRRLVDLGLPVPRFASYDCSEESAGSGLGRLWQAVEAVGNAPFGYSVRSAASDEDLSDSSAAGRYRSFNALVSRTEIARAVADIERHHRAVAPKDSGLRIIVQETHAAACSGVAFAYTDETGDMSVEVEAYFGGCRAVTDGLLPPYRLSSVGGAVEACEDSTAGFFRFTAHASLFGPLRSRCPPGTLLRPRLADWPAQTRLFTTPRSRELPVYGYRPPAVPDRIFDAASRLIPLLGQLPAGNHDIEWGASPDGEVSLYQWRPITATPPRPAGQPAAPEVGVLTGLPAASGSATGRIAHAADHRSGEILMLGEATVRDVDAIASSRGVVSSMGGMLSHIAIMCRELGKPCVAGINEMIPPGTPVEVDGHTGRVKILSTGGSVR